MIRVAILFVFGALLAACSKAPGELEIRDAFIYELPPNKTLAAAYMVIENLSDGDHALNYIHSPIADYIEIHRSIYEEGMMQMRQVQRIRLSPGEKVVLEPGGYHLMVFGVYDPLKSGDSFEMHFEFESGLKMTKLVEVRSR